MKHHLTTTDDTEQTLDIEKLAEDKDIEALFKRRRQVDLQTFQAVMNKDPLALGALSKCIKFHPLFKDRDGNPVPYMPIGIQETLLDRFFFGLWQTSGLTEWRELNSICAVIELRVFHPVAEEWITRTGSGAVPIQLVEGAKPNEFDKIQHTSLQKNVPSAKSFAFTNAAGSLGKIFGRDLGRRDDEQMAFKGAISEEKAEGVRNKSWSQLVAERREQKQAENQPDSQEADTVSDEEE